MLCNLRRSLMDCSECRDVRGGRGLNVSRCRVEVGDVMSLTPQVVT